MLQTCNNCKNLKLFIKFIADLDEVELESEVTYKQWTKAADGTVVRNTNHGALNDVLNLLQKQLVYFLWHVYVKRTQSRVFTNLKKNLPYGKLLIQVDFSENYSHTYQDEIQSAHWQNTSSTLYTSMIYYRENSTATDVASEPYVVISDYNHHDKYAVIGFNKLILEKFSEKHPELKVREIEFQSDGTSQHFKQKYTIFSMTLNEIPTTWHFSATSHGKGCIDGIGGTIKRRVREVCTARKADARTPLEFANVAKTICTGINILYESEKQIEAAKAKLDKMWVNNGQEIKGMPGTRKAHCFRSYGSGIVFYSLTSDCEKGTLFNFRSGDCVENVRYGECDL